jgi:hypothetical protein
MAKSLRVPTLAGVREINVKAPKVSHWDTWTDAKVVLYSNARPLQNNRWAGIYTSVPVEQVTTCEHVETMCSQCVDQWQTDYVVRFFDHGGNGYVSHGCRCTECRNGAKFYMSEHKHGRSVGC